MRFARFMALASFVLAACDGGITVHGHVRDAKGAPLEGLSMKLSLSPTSERLNSPVEMTDRNDWVRLSFFPMS